LAILVTGGAGFIGSHLLDRLVKGGERPVCLDNFDDFYSPLRKHSNIAPLLARDAIELIEADIADSETVSEVLRRYRIDTIFHLAARAGVRPSLADPELYERVNALGTLRLLEAARKSGVKKFLFASSSSVYGGNRKVPFSENDTADSPISPYAASKKSAELYAYAFHHLYGLEVICFRIFTAYGPRQRPEMAIHKFAAAIEKGREITIFGDGTTGRDYTYVEDVVEGLVAGLRANLGFEVINIGDSKVVLLKDLVSILEKALGKKARIRREKESPADPRLTFADISKAQRLLGYAPKVPIEEGIGRFVGWLRSEGKDLP